MIEQPAARERENPVFKEMIENVKQRQSNETAWQMSVNLGAGLSAEYDGNVPKSAIKQLFVQAFGEDLFVSKLKNRKRLLLLPDEYRAIPKSFKNNQVSRSGGDFYTLALKIWSNPQDAVFSLCKKTSLLPSGFSHEGHIDYDDKIIQNICMQIAEKHNLAAYFDTLYGNKIGPKYHEKNSREAESAIHRLNMGEYNSEKKYDPLPVNLSSKKNAFISDKSEWTCWDYGRHGPHSISPTVYLGTLYTPRPMLEISFNNEVTQEILGKLEQHSGSLTDLFVNEFGQLPFFEEYENPIYPYEENFESEAKEWLKALAKISSQNISISTAYAARHVTLILAKQKKDDLVVPSILLSRHCVEYEDTHKTCSKAEIKRFWFDGVREFYFILESKTGFMDLFTHGYFDSPYDPLEHICGPLPLSGEMGKMVLKTEQSSYWKWLHKFDLLELNQESVFIPDFKFDEDIPSPYPSNTIMGMLHRHIQSRKPEDSIFQVLQTEAEWFCNALQEHLAKIQANLSNVEESYKGYFS